MGSHRLRLNMWRLLPLATVALGAPVEEAVAPSDSIGNGCEWVEQPSGTYGVTVNCLPGWVMAGMCGSGSRSDCQSHIFASKIAYQIYCCPTSHTNDPCNEGGQYQVSSDYGQSLNCNTNNSKGAMDVMVGGCGSGRYHDCTTNSGTSVANVANCCTTGDITVGPTNMCAWRWGNYGDYLTCPDGYAAAGACGSGAYRDCNNGSAYTGVWCCPSVDNKNPT